MMRKGHKIGCKVKEMVAKSKVFQRAPNFDRNANAKRVKAL